MWKLIFNLIMKRKFPGKTVESLTKRQLREVESEAIRTLNRTKGKKGDVFQLPSGGKDRVPVNQQFTPPREGHVFEILDDDAFKELKGNFFRRLMANTDEDVQAFAKRVVANKQDVKLEKLTQGQRKEFMNMVDDRITLGNKKFMEKYTDEFPLPKEFNIYEDFASGGITRVPFGRGKKVLEGLAWLANKIAPKSTQIGKTSKTLADKTQLRQISNSG